ncbi:MAG: stage II sporulation protein M [Eubacteriales bacterium]|nr:stage II sporulation protein M [Eubacteriales bacterium]
MKGIVLNFPRRFRRMPKTEARMNLDAKSFLRRYGVMCFYVIAFAFGVLLGSIFASRCEKSTLESLDFLFTTNLDARLSQPMHMTFASSFASNFLFLLGTFLLGLTAWGAFCIFLVPMFKGFGTGLCAGYLIINFGFRGVGFYLLVMLGGLFLMSFALLVMCGEAHAFSLSFLKLFMLRKELPLSMNGMLRTYCLRSLYMLMLSAGASLLDMLLWTAFAKLFF